MFSIQNLYNIVLFLQGDKIYATVKKDLVNQFNPFLALGKRLTFINFSLDHSYGSYRTTNHVYKISFLLTTLVKISEDLLRGLNGFTPVNFQEVLDETLNPEFLVGEYCVHVYVLYRYD